MYEDTAGLTVGDGVERTGKPLSVELGPGLLSTIFDGIQRPLKQIAINSGDVFIPRGVDVPALDRKKAYEFKPSKVKVSCLKYLCCHAHVAPAFMSAPSAAADQSALNTRCTVILWQAEISSSDTLLGL